MKNILILEDEAVLAEIYKKNLENAGYEVECAEDVEVALEKLKSFKPDLALVDHGIRGKEKSGLDFIVELKKLSPDTRAIMLSNYNNIELKEAAEKAGAEDFLVKLDVPPRILVGYLDKLFS